MLNVRGIVSKINLKEIQKVVRANDIIGLTETLSNAFDANEFPDHDVFTGLDKLKIHGYRGLAFMVRKSLKHEFNETNLGLWLNLRIDCIDYSIGLYYVPCESSRHWRVDHFEEIQDDVLKYKRLSRTILIMGDFNARTGNLIDSIELDGESINVLTRHNKDDKVNTNGRMLTDFCKATEILIVNGRVGENSGSYTCVTHNGRSTIDYFLAECSVFDSVVSFSVEDFEPCLSDVHCLVQVELSNGENVSNATHVVKNLHVKRIWNENKRILFHDELCKRSFSEIRSVIEIEANALPAVNECNAMLGELLRDTAKSVGALQVVNKQTIRSRNRWFDSECRIQRSIYRKKLRHAKRTGSLREKKNASKEYSFFLKQKRLNWEAAMNKYLKAKLNDPKEYWSFFKNLVRSEDEIPIKKSVFFEHFKSLNSASNASQFNSATGADSNNEHNDDINKMFTELEVQNCLRKIKNGKSAGLDNVFPEFIKYIPDSLTKIITLFFNKILDTGEVPDDWAVSVYQPIYKKGDKTNPNNYRGVSLASCMCKLFTAILAQRIEANVEKRDVLGNEQAGFRKNIGCIDQAFILSSLINIHLARKKKLYLTFIDYEKAFDRVDHGLLWKKLEKLEINGKVLQVIRNLYEKTKACVRVNGEITDMFDCCIGVRQGDSLSPLLFIIFLNDFDVLLRSSCEGVTLNTNDAHESSVANDLEVLSKMYTLLYADDTLLLSESEADMQRALDATHQYCVRNNMTINASKTKFMICSRGKTRKTPTFVVNGIEIERVDTFCYLGIIFKYNNTFQSSIKNNVDKAKKALFKLEVISSKIDFELETKLNLSDTLIQPILLYGCEIWGHENVEQIEIFHRNFLRRILRVRKSVPKAMIYGELGRKEFKYAIWKRMASFWKKVSNNHGKLTNTLYSLTRLKNHETRWFLGVKNILINSGVPLIDNYISDIGDADFNRFITRQCEDLALHSWYTMMKTTSICECYATYKHRLCMEKYLYLLKGKDRISLTQFRCAPLTLPRIVVKLNVLQRNDCLYCEDVCKADEYHLLLVCKKFRYEREKYLPVFFYMYPNLIKFDQLMNSVNVDLLRNLSALCRTICDASID